MVMSHRLRIVQSLSSLVILKSASSFTPLLSSTSSRSHFSSPQTCRPHIQQSRFRLSSARLFSSLSPRDQEYLRDALECAKKGLGHTFPNPAVGCVLVRGGRSNRPDDGGVVIGRGFHPRAGFPHAEVFALLQAAGHVTCGVDAAESIVRQKENQHQKKQDMSSYQAVVDLTRQYCEDGGARTLLADCCATSSKDEQGSVTAFVTLEPCCHTGKRTPPCATSLIQAGVSRVVVGIRDPNPRVDGGGVDVLRQAGMEVIVLNEATNAVVASTDNTNEVMPEKINDDDDKIIHPAASKSLILLENDCAALIANFCKRIAPRPASDNHLADPLSITGKMRSDLRAESARRHQTDALPDVIWGGATVDSLDKDTLETNVNSLDIDPSWMEHVDGLLWQHELVLLRLGKAAKKRKGAELLGHRIAELLQAHVAQTKGHTVLLYRPGRPPVIDWDASTRPSSNLDEQD